MKLMRQILLGFLTLIMITPSLACAMTYCPMPVKSEQKPCHQSKDDQKNVPMLMLDCMGIDLFQPVLQADTPPPDNSVDMVHFPWVDLATEYSFQPDNRHFIRGPPFDIGRSQSQSSIIITTQRFRI